MSSFTVFFGYLNEIDAVSFLIRMNEDILSLSLKFEENPSSGCWDNTLLIFWGCLSSEVVFISSNILFWFGPLSLSLKFEENLSSGCWDIPLLMFWCHLPLEVVFISTKIKIWFGPLSSIVIRPVVDEIFHF